ncbi:MAG: penicillin-binding transpeptidase domain-containing protein [Bryobacteraceae bacterium]|jgi:beta-lactamase class D
MKRLLAIWLARALGLAFLVSLVSGPSGGEVPDQTPRKPAPAHAAKSAAGAKKPAPKPASAAKKSTATKPASAARKSAARKPELAAMQAPARPVAAPRAAVKPAVVAGGPWTEPTFADSTEGDNVDGEDLNIRRAAVEALGPYNGSVVVVDPSNGRILTMVNQKLALGDGFQPCSTIKVAVALAGLSEKAIQPETKLRLSGLGKMDLTYALAHSNNYYFATLGQKLGFAKVNYYARLFGYGEKAGLNIAGEQPGRFPSGPPSNGGVGMLSSFGEEISQTPLQLAALMTAVANGGTLYYLQYPHTPEAAKGFVPRVKRRPPVADLIPLVTQGMRGAVEFGTAHRARDDGPIAGKTGTCSEGHTHLGWFGSFFNDANGRQLVVVVLLTGGRPDSGPLAAGIGGDVYRILGERNYFSGPAPLLPAVLLMGGSAPAGKGAAAGLTPGPSGSRP